MKKQNTFIVELREDITTGDLICPIPEQITSELEWYEGTELRWIVDGDEVILYEVKSNE